MAAYSAGDDRKSYRPQQLKSDAEPSRGSSVTNKSAQTPKLNVSRMMRGPVNRLGIFLTRETNMAAKLHSTRVKAPNIPRLPVIAALTIRPQPSEEGQGTLGQEQK